jgi:hypothetical protein
VQSFPQLRNCCGFLPQEKADSRGSCYPQNTLTPVIYVEKLYACVEKSYDEAILLMKYQGNID